MSMNQPRIGLMPEEQIAEIRNSSKELLKNISSKTLKEQLAEDVGVYEFEKQIPQGLEKPTWSGIIRQSIRENSLIGLMDTPYSEAENQRFKIDEAFANDEKAKQKLIDEEFSDIRPEYRKRLVESSNSPDELRFNAKEALQISMNRTFLENQGFATTIATDLLGSMADIPIIAGATMISPFAGVALGATKLRAFATGAVADIAFNALQDNLGYRDVQELEYVLGATFSGTVNSVITGMANKKVLVNEEVQKYYMNEAMGITPEIEKKVAQAQTKDEKQKIILEAYNTKRSEIQELENIVDLDERMDAYYKNAKTGLDRRLQEGTISKNAYNAVRTDMEFLTKKSKSITFRQLANNMFIDATLQNNLSNARSLSELQDTYEQIGIATYRNNFIPLEREFSKLKKKTFTEYISPSFLDNSQIQVSRIAGEIQALRDNRIADDDIIVRKVAKDFVAEEFGLSPDDAIKFTEKVLEANKKTSMFLGQLNARFLDKNSIAEDGTAKNIRDNYFTNIYTFRARDELLSKGFDTKDIENYFYGALESFTKQHKSPTLTKQEVAILRSVARELSDFLTTSRTATVGLGRDKGSLFDEVSNSTIQKILRDNDGNLISSDEIKKFLEAISTDTGSRFQRTRMPLDRSYIYRAKNGKEITMADFIEKDFGAVMGKYLKEQGGRIAGQRFVFKKPVVDAEGRVITEPSGDLHSTFKEEYMDLGSDEGANFLRARIAGELESLKNQNADNLKILDEKLKSGEINKAQYKQMKDDLIITDDEIKADMTRLEFMLAHLHGKPTASFRASEGGSYGYGHRFLQMLQNFNVFRLLGTTPLAMMAEAHNVGAYFGVKNIMKTKGFKGVSKFYTDGRFTTEAREEALLVNGIGSEFMHGYRSAVYDHDFDVNIYNQQKSWFDRALNKGLDVSERLAEFTLQIGGMKPFHYALQTYAYAGIIKTIRNIAKGDMSGMNKQIAKEMGIDDDMIIRISKQIDTYENKTNGTIGYELWDDREAQEIFSIHSRRLIDNIVQKPTLGGKLGIAIDDMIVGQTVGGKALMELKQYLYQSYTKQFGKLVNSRSKYHYLMTASQAGFLTLLYIPEAYVRSGGDREEFEKKISPMGLVENVANRSSAMGVPFALLGSGSRIGTGENLLSSFGNSRADGVVNYMLHALPTVDLLNKVANVPASLYEATVEGKPRRLVDTFFALNTNILPMQVFKAQAKSKLNDRDFLGD